MDLLRVYYTLLSTRWVDADGLTFTVQLRIESIKVWKDCSVCVQFDMFPLIKGIVPMIRGIIFIFKFSIWKLPISVLLRR